MSDSGAHFFRCDLQVHTPRDRRWKGPDAVTNEERQAYARSLVDACRQRGLQGIGITDHHDMLFAAYIRRAAQEETDTAGNPLPPENRLVVFPGMELTLGVPCQALLLFDADFPDDLFELALNALAITPSPPTEAKTAETERLEHITSLKKLKDELDKHAYLKERYIVFPNVSGEGEFSVLRKGFAGKYAEMPWVGGYVDGTVTALKEGERSRIEGRDKAWGNKRIACFQTSDNRRADHADLGKHSTWIKWATPTAEALRQACLAQESRVAHERPRLPAVAVGAISVSNSSFLGPVDLDINPQYSALIGGRGTGKSTILEYLRWALCDQPPGIADEDTPNYQARRARLIEETLKPLKATVEVRFEINRVPHLLRRASEDGSLRIKIGDDDLRTCTEDEVRSLLPIQAYSQKQLSDVSVRIEELGRFVTAPVRTELAQIDRGLADRASNVREAFTTRQRQRALARTLQKRGLEEKSLQQQASAIRGSLTDLTDEEEAFLDRGKTFETADRAVRAWQRGITSLQDDAVTLRKRVDAQLEQLESPPAEPEPEILQRAHDEYRALLADAKDSLDAVIARASEMSVEPEAMPSESPWRQWSEQLANVRIAHEAAVQKSTTYREQLEHLQEIDAQISDHASETDRVKQEMRGLESAEDDYQSARNDWRALLDQRDDLLAAECARLTEASGGTIRARVQRHADSAEFVAALRRSVSGSRVHGNKIEALGESITEADDPVAQWDALLLDLEKLADFDAEQDAAVQRPETPALTVAGLTPGETDRIADRFDPDDWLALSLKPITSQPVFEYESREGDYIPFRNASAGQQATALLKTLLNQPGPPLIIDQPEEDLDNPVILEIVEQVWRAKQARQLMFASHNANLVVNGDAELVGCCDYRTTGDQSRGTIAHEGAIDVGDVREAIERIMEGGKEAFNLRKDKYGF